MDINLDDWISQHTEYKVDRIQSGYYRLHPSDTHPRVNTIIFPDGDIPELYINPTQDKLSITDLGTVWNQLDMCLMSRISNDIERDNILTSKMKFAAEQHYIQDMGACYIDQVKSVDHLSNSIENMFNAIVALMQDLGILYENTKPVNI